jgi:hypothetical protein
VKTNQQPVLVMFEDEEGDICLKEFKSHFGLKCERQK